MDESFSSLINKSESLLIILPQNPSFDQVAAGLSLYLSTRDRKETSIYCPSQMLVEFNRIVGVNKVSQEFGNKNLVMKFEDYPAKSIERVSYDIEDSQFKLTIIPKVGSPSPKKAQIRLSYSGVTADCIVLISGNSQSDFPFLTSQDITSSKLVHIGTRDFSVSDGPRVLSFARPASCLSEVVAFLIREGNFTLDNDIATNLLAGIEKASRNFSTNEVTANTFEVVAYLMKKGGRRLSQEKELQKGFPSPLISGPLESVEKEKPKDPPKDWLEPKIYKGSSIS